MIADDSSTYADARQITRRYHSFVVRCWRVAGQQERVDVEHLQSGGRTRVLTFSDAAAWMSAECDTSVKGSGARGRIDESRQGGNDRSTRPCSRTTTESAQH